MTQVNPTSLSDVDLLSSTQLAAQQERGATAHLIALIAEVDARRLYLSQSCSSMFVFCTRTLHLSEHAAFARIEAARLARRFPTILERLADGRLTLTNIGLLAPHLIEDTSDALFEAAQHKSKRDVEGLIAALHPQPDIPSSVRALAVRSAGLPLEESTSSSTARAVPVVRTDPPRRAIVAPLAPTRHLLRVTISEETRCKLERARALLRHQIPSGDAAALIDRALTLLVAEAERTKFAATKRSRESHRQAAPTGRRTRRIPSAIRRAVWGRDEGRCAFATQAGRCNETAFLEFHHVQPFATGGASTVENLELRCRAHNRYEAERAGLALWPAEGTRSGRS